MVRDTLICTVGTSLINNLIHTENGTLRNAIESENLKEVVLTLLGMDPSERLCGAEINSNYSIFKKGLVKPRSNLYLLVSDTQSGVLVGEILKNYYLSRRNEWKFVYVDYLIVSALSDAEPPKFRVSGLRNLVKEISYIARRHGSERLLINATGGYKAQISFAGLIGQALDVPVCYLFEKFSEIIELPPQPISFDFSFWLNNVVLFYQLAEGVLDIDSSSLDNRFETLIELLEEGNETLAHLSPTGELFHQMFCHHFEKEKINMLPKPSNIPTEKKIIKYEDGNSRKHHGLSVYLDKLLQKPYIVRIYTHYYNPDLPSKNEFRPSTRGKFSHLEGKYTDGKATTKFDIVTTAKNKLERDAVLADLLSNARKYS